MITNMPVQPSIRPINPMMIGLDQVRSKQGLTSKSLSWLEGGPVSGDELTVTDKLTLLNSFDYTNAGIKAFDAVGDHIIAPMTMNANSDFTMRIIIRMNGDQVDYKNYFGRWGIAGSMSFHVYPNNDFRFNISHIEGGSSSKLFASGGALGSNWHEYKAVKTGTTVLMYLDGNQVNSHDLTGYTYDTAMEVCIGRQHATATVYAGPFDMAEAELIVAGTQYFYWTFGNGRTTDVPDIETSANHGSITTTSGIDVMSTYDTSGQVESRNNSKGYTPVMIGDGTASYIDTGVDMSSSHDVEMVIDNSNSAGSQFHGTYVSNRYFFGPSSLATSWNLGYKNYNSVGPATVPEDHQVKINITNGKMYVNDVEYIDPAQGSFLTAGNFYICARNFVVDDYFTTHPVYYCKIWDNGTLVRNFIPYENDKMIDLVNNTIYTAGAGTISKVYYPIKADLTSDIYGNAIVNPAGFTHNGSEVKIVPTDVRVLSKITVSGVDPAYNGDYYYKDTYNGKPRYKKEFGVVDVQIYWDSSNWVIELPSVFLEAHPSATGTFPPTSGWPTITLSYDCLFVDNEEFIARTHAEILANNADTDHERSSYDDNNNIVDMFTYVEAPEGSPLAILNNFLDSRHS